MDTYSILGDVRGSDVNDDLVGGSSHTPSLISGFTPSRTNGRPASRAASRGTSRTWTRKQLSRNGHPDEWERATLDIPNPGLVSVKSHFEHYIHDRPQGMATWLQDPDVPTAREIGTVENGRLLQGPELEIEIDPNKPEGGWESKKLYLETHYQLLRQDGITPLRNAVDEVRMTPSLIEKKSRERSRIYENVYITGVTVARQGLALKIEFSTRRAEKRILWGQSKRLKTGTIVALTPVKDKFKSKCVVAVVASRRGVDLNVEAPVKPSIQIYVGDPRDIEIDPQQEWMMVEASSGYWEATRHTLKALQKLHDESFPLSEHIVEVQRTVSAPQYRQDEPFMDLSAISAGVGKLSYNVDVLQDWPTLGSDDSTLSSGSATLPFVSEFDTSQLDALRRILTKRLAIIQGPPGTGKSHISLVALKMLLQQSGPHDPPIIVAAQTNHAVDQLLRHINEFEPDFVRVGGQTTDYEIIKPRTLYAIRERQNVKQSATSKQVTNVRKQTIETLDSLLQPLTSKLPIDTEALLEHGLISQVQFHSLQHVESNWVGVGGLGHDTVMGIYCEDTLVQAEKKRGLLLYGNTYQEFDETEKLDEEELEISGELNDEYDVLRGKHYELQPGFTTRTPSVMTDTEIRTLLRETDDMTKIPFKQRGDIYNYLQRELKAKIRDRFREVGKTCQAQAQDLQIGRWESDFTILRGARIIGMTTTGLSKNRGLITSLKPRIVLIEEAAETLEAYTTAACFPSLEHLILVGDHQQLRGHCAHRDFEGHPCYLDVSMFERLINNQTEFTQLIKQRRMRPEFRSIIQPIYPALADHDSVLNREDIPGMGGVNCHFFSHDNAESNDDMLSKKNELEARLIVAFYEYLVCNQVKMNEITILTFYAGQRSLIRHLFKRNRAFEGRRVNIATVDSYQGEENEVVLLSLVRNNARGQIGFLGVLNRVCVALSRARRGLYVFGSAGLLAQQDKQWKRMLTIMVNGGHVKRFLPIKCENHGTTMEVTSYHDFMDRDGGCEEDCGGALPCGHRCALRCHTIPHEAIKCMEVCPNTMPCGHQCDQLCWRKPCICGTCAAVAIQAAQARRAPSDRSFRTRPSAAGAGVGIPRSAVQAQGVRAWGKYAAGGHKEDDARLRAQAQADWEAAKVAKVVNGVERLGVVVEEEGRKNGVEKRKGKKAAEEEPLIELGEAAPAPSDLVNGAPGKGKKKVWREKFTASML